MLIPSIDPILVDTNGFVELLRSLEVHKAAGPDETLKGNHGIDLLAPLLTFYHHCKKQVVKSVVDSEHLYIFSDGS